MNERIRPQDLLVVDESGSLGVMHSSRALELARERELDLILVAPEARPAVAKILDYGKYLYDQKRTAKKQQAQGKAKDVKGIKLGLRMGEHDLQVRLDAAIKFLLKGHKLKAFLQFRGREAAHADLGFAKMKNFAERLDELAKLDESPRKIGQQIIMTLSPKPEAIKKANQQKANEKKNAPTGKNKSNTPPAQPEASKAKDPSDNPAEIV